MSSNAPAYNLTDAQKACFKQETSKKKRQIHLHKKILTSNPLNQSIRSDEEEFSTGALKPMSICSQCYFTLLQWLACFPFALKNPNLFFFFPSLKCHNYNIIMKQQCCSHSEHSDGYDMIHLNATTLLRPRLFSVQSLRQMCQCQNYQKKKTCTSIITVNIDKQLSLMFQAIKPEVK